MVVDGVTVHISDATLEALSRRGWVIYGLKAHKHFPRVADAGTLSDGSRTATVEFDQSGRWLSFYDGWDIAFDMDSREWVGRPVEFAAQIERRVYAHISDQER